MNKQQIVVIMLSCLFFIQFANLNTIPVTASPLPLSRTVMPWMGLERTSENIKSDLSQMNASKENLTDMSYEDYDLGATANIVYNGFTSVNGYVLAANLGSYPMITTVNITKLRTLFASPSAFIIDCVNRTVTYNYTGYNIDFEPSGGTSIDAANFANFLTQFADALHAKGKKLGVDYASWDPFWNIDLINQSSVDQVITMDTYASSLTTFTSALNTMIAHVSHDKINIGLITPLTLSAMTSRFSLIESHNIDHVSIWNMSIPGFWWPLLHDFLYAGVPAFPSPPLAVILVVIMAIPIIIYIKKSIDN